MQNKSRIIEQHSNLISELQARIRQFGEAKQQLKGLEDFPKEETLKESRIHFIYSLQFPKRQNEAEL